MTIVLTTIEFKMSQVLTPHNVFMLDLNSVFHPNSKELDHPQEQSTFILDLMEGTDMHFQAVKQMNGDYLLATTLQPLIFSLKPSRTRTNSLLIRNAV